MIITAWLAAGAVLLAGVPAGAPAGARPIVIGHRGASAVLPEHTLLAYRAAIAMGADYIEPDLVSTRDHVLVARHENEISATTDVARHPEFAARRTTRTVDGLVVTGWFTEDFTLRELRTLRAVERAPDVRPRSAAFDGVARIATFDEVAALAARTGTGLYVETKHPAYFAARGLALEPLMLATIARLGLERSGRVYVESFETAGLRALRRRSRLRLVQLLDVAGAPRDLAAAGDRRTYRDLATPAGLREIAGYADAVGVPTGMVIPQGPDGRLGPPTTLVRDAHLAGLAVHVWTVAPENGRLPAEFRLGDPAAPGYAAARGDVAGWLRRLFALGVDGVFADDPAVPRRVGERMARAAGQASAAAGSAPSWRSSSA
ncbi:glycerophosphoryl diester phosphodiesterase [Sphaerisporangium rufum]|uniref:glycerophosphodiester phosphodiesterase n=1 Tax=Sphaerisporangium rufum TaxID=1381558 RepID=A0A919V3S3_9ACTN|nr:glycerophosphodiester phosphodiesterase family protein [Sphaerisporangium rufum]GII76560.1 glycerophosphoryl diester phosphodiesterase [Sphaerisporangium rufum]